MSHDRTAPEVDFRSAKVPKGPKGTLLMGSLGDVRRDPITFTMRMATEYAPVARVRLGPLVTHLISHPAGVRRVLIDNVQNYSKNHLSYSFVRRVLGNGLLTSQGPFWLRQRRLAQPAFHRERIAHMATAMTRATEELAAVWSENPDEPRDVGEDLMALTLRIVGDALFGTGVEARQTERVARSFNVLSAQLVERFRTMRLLPPVLPTAYDRQFRQATQELDSVVAEIIAAKRAKLEDTGDLLSMLMLAKDEETGEQMNDAQLVSETKTMLLAGHETTATTLMWLFALLEQHPEAEARLHAELRDVLGGRTPTMADVPKLQYTRCVIEETLRLYPPVYILGRKVEQDDVLCGYRIPKGTSVDVSPFAMHRLPEFWERPNDFVPERFASEEQAKRPRGLYIPFLAGPRQCIGNSFALMEAQLIVATLAQRFRPRSERRVMPDMDPLVTLRPRGGLHMRPGRRSSDTRAA